MALRRGDDCVRKQEGPQRYFGRFHDYDDLRGGFGLRLGVILDAPTSASNPLRHGNMPPILRQASKWACPHAVRESSPFHRLAIMMDCPPGAEVSTDIPLPGDREIRLALRHHLRRRWAEQPTTLFIEELGLCRGQVRVDLAVVNGLLHGYEIKSDRDRLNRLPTQVQMYSAVLDRATIVTGRRHLHDVLKIVPVWWGVLGVELDQGRAVVRSVRPAHENPGRVPRALAELLWRDEALALLESRRAAQGVRSKPRAAIWDRLCEVLDVTEIAAAVRNRLRSRAENSAPA